MAGFEVTTSGRFCVFRRTDGLGAATYQVVGVMEDAQFSDLRRFGKATSHCPSRRKPPDRRGTRIRVLPTGAMSTSHNSE